MAAAWAVLHHLGDEGYLRLTAAARRACLELAAGIARRPSLVLRARAGLDACSPSAPPTRPSSTSSPSPTRSGGGAGTSTARARPASLHCTVNAVHDGLIADFLAVLDDSVEAVTAATTGSPGAVGAYGTIE